MTISTYLKNQVLTMTETDDEDDQYAPTIKNFTTNILQYIAIVKQEQQRLFNLILAGNSKEMPVHYRLADFEVVQKDLKRMINITNLLLRHVYK